MATQPINNPPGGAPAGQTGGGTGALPGLASPPGSAAAIAAKHAAPVKPAGSAPKNIGGRRSTEVEAREWLARQGLVAVPAGQAAAADFGPPVQPLDPALVKEVVRILLDGYSELRVGWLRSKVSALKLGPALETEAEKLAAVRPANAKVMVESSPLVLEKMGISGEHLPLVAFFGAFATDLAQFGAAMRTFQQMARDRAEALKDSPPAKPQDKA